MSPDTLILFANLGRPRRPSGASAARSELVLPDAATAARQLAPLTNRKVRTADLPALRRLHRAAADAGEALVAGRPVNWYAINALARASTARVEVTTAPDGSPRRHLAWHDPTVCSYLARCVIEELVALEPQRLRHCARLECGLIFYDNTRSRTRRWHAEDPCGWRERQRQRRAAAANSS